MRPKDKLAIKNIDGIATQFMRNDGKPAFFLDGVGFWRRVDKSIDLEVNSLLVELSMNIEKSFLSPSERHVMSTRPWISEVGLTPESQLSKVDFEKIITRCKGSETINRCLYCADVSALASNISISCMQIFQFTGVFYSVLNDSTFSQYTAENKSGIELSRSCDTYLLYGYLESIFIRLRAILDYVTKLAFEAEKLKTDFAGYPKLEGKDKQYKDKEQLMLNWKKEALFFQDPIISKIISIRNRLVHDGHLDINTRVYEKFEHGKLIERYILFPDMTSGNFDSYKNRKSFHSSETKINLILPELLDEFFSRLIATITEINNIYENRSRE